MATFHRKPAAGHRAGGDNSQLWPVPKPTRDPHMLLSDMVGAAEITAIEKQGQLQFHATGDTGVGMNSKQPEVADAMAKEVNTAHPANGPVFFLNLGDVIYGNDKSSLYTDRFYQPNMSYFHPAPGFDGVILAVPGNHDGEVRDPRDSPSLSAFLQNFCAEPGTQPPLAESYKAVMPNQPGVYWYLEAPFLDLIGLYSNAGENYGMLGKDNSDTHQSEWLTKMLQTLQKSYAKAKSKRKALVFAVHHPPYNRGLLDSGLGHGGSPEMQAQLDAACAAAGLWPDAVFSGHSHNYQRYLRKCTAADGSTFSTSYFVAGTGGISPQPVTANIGNSKDETPTPHGLKASKVGYLNGLKTYGYLRVAASAETLQVTFVPYGDDQPDQFETVTMDLATHDLQFP